MLRFFSKKYMYVHIAFWPLIFCILFIDDTFNYEAQERLMDLRESHVHPNGSHVHSRKRRSESRELHLEVLVVADSKMARYHGGNLNHYILTLMSTVRDWYSEIFSLLQKARVLVWYLSQATRFKLPLNVSIAFGNIALIFFLNIK